MFQTKPLLPEIRSISSEQKPTNCALILRKRKCLNSSRLFVHLLSVDRESEPEHITKIFNRKQRPNKDHLLETVALRPQGICPAFLND